MSPRSLPTRQLLGMACLGYRQHHRPDCCRAILKSNAVVHLCRQLRVAMARKVDDRRKIAASAAKVSNKRHSVTMEVRHAKIAHVSNARGLAIQPHHLGRFSKVSAPCLKIEKRRRRAASVTCEPGGKSSGHVRVERDRLIVPLGFCRSCRHGYVELRRKPRDRPRNRLGQRLPRSKSFWQNGLLCSRRPKKRRRSVNWRPNRPAACQPWSAKPPKERRLPPTRPDRKQPSVMNMYARSSSSCETPKPRLRPFK